MTFRASVLKFWFGLSVFDLVMESVLTLLPRKINIFLEVNSISLSRKVLKCSASWSEERQGLSSRGNINTCWWGVGGREVKGCRMSENKCSSLLSLRSTVP